MGWYCWGGMEGCRLLYGLWWCLFFFVDFVVDYIVGNSIVDGVDWVIVGYD